MNIVLIGFMCSGKSRVGQALAKKLSWPFFDTDEMITNDVGISIADIINKQGEPAFRSLEKNAVRLVSMHPQAVIATGGGVPLDPSNVTALKENGQLIWLKVLPETVIKRAGNLKSRPLIDPKDPQGSVRMLMAAREQAYSQANHRIDVDTMTPEAVADKIVSLLKIS